jgi:hypothetical protein
MISFNVRAGVERVVRMRIDIDGPLPTTLVGATVTALWRRLDGVGNVVTGSEASRDATIVDATTKTVDATFLAADFSALTTNTRAQLRLRITYPSGAVAYAPNLEAPALEFGVVVF